MIEQLEQLETRPTDSHANQQRTCLPVMFITTSMPVGGAEVLLVNLIRKMNRERFAPELCCLKDRGPLGEELSHEIPVYSNLLSGKWDVRVLPRLVRLFKQRKTMAVVTVGAGDKMFWGRLAAWLAGVPVVMSAIHSTGWPDVIGRLNRMLTPLTDAFIGVAPPHGRYLIDEEGFPPHKVRVIPNGVDVDRFHPDVDGMLVRRELGFDANTPIAGIVAALRPEKDHAMLLRAWQLVRTNVPNAQLLIVGDGPERERLQSLAAEFNIKDSVHFLGTRNDIPQLVAAMNVFVLTSKMEANPVSILEAMATAKPVIAPNVGSIPDSVAHEKTGYLTEAGNAEQVAKYLTDLLTHPEKATAMGLLGRTLVERRWSLECMVDGYEKLIEGVLERKS